MTPRFRVAVDARVLLRHIGGINVYLTEIIHWAGKLRPDIEFLLCVDRDEKTIETFLSNNLNCKVKIIPLPFISLETGGNYIAPIWLHYVVPLKIGQREAALFWGPNLFVPGRLCSIPQVVTVHDFGPYQKYYSEKPLWKLMFKIVFPYGLKSCKAVILDSKYVEAECHKRFPFTINKTKTIHLGLRTLKSERSDYESCKDYILAVGNITDRKNYTTLIDSYNLIRKAGIKSKLIVCGVPGWGFDDVRNRIRKYDLEGHVILETNVDDETLYQLYANAALFVMPSYYEGFGLPALEAMSFGLPCIVSNNSSLPEIVNDAGICLPPDDVNLWADNMKKLLLDTELSKSFSAKAIERAKQFTWTKAAEETISVFEGIISN